MATSRARSRSTIRGERSRPGADGYGSTIRRTREIRRTCGPSRSTKSHKSFRRIGGRHHPDMQPGTLRCTTRSSTTPTPRITFSTAANRSVVHIVSPGRTVNVEPALDAASGRGEPCTRAAICATQGPASDCCRDRRLERDGAAMAHDRHAGSGARARGGLCYATIAVVVNTARTGAERGRISCRHHAVAREAFGC